MLIKKFDCEKCNKSKVCKYKEIDVPEVYSAINERLDNKYCPTVITFEVNCLEYNEVINRRGS